MNPFGRRKFRLLLRKTGCDVRVLFDAHDKNEPSISFILTDKGDREEMTPDELQVIKEDVANAKKIKKKPVVILPTFNKVKPEEGKFCPVVTWQHWSTQVYSVGDGGDISNEIVWQLCYWARDVFNADTPAQWADTLKKLVSDLMDFVANYTHILEEKEEEKAAGGGSRTKKKETAAGGVGGGGTRTASKKKAAGGGGAEVGKAIGKVVHWTGAVYDFYHHSLGNPGKGPHTTGSLFYIFELIDFTTPGAEEIVRIPLARILGTGQHEAKEKFEANVYRLHTWNYDYIPRDIPENIHLIIPPP